MATKKRRKKKKIQGPLDPHMVLDGSRRISALELIRLIHSVNPTSREMNAHKASERYRLKAQLQSLLIRRFGEGLRVEGPTPENPDLIGLRLSRFNEDACHALIQELDEDAASWVKRRIDEATSETASNPENTTEVPETGGPPSRNGLPEETAPAPTNENLSADKCIRLGKNALDIYDYDACEKHFRLALKATGGGIEAAVLMLELYVNHLGAYEKALGVSADFSPGALRDDTVRLLLGLASVHCGHFRRAMDYVDRISDARVAEIYLPAARHFIEEDIETLATKALSKLKSYATASHQVDIQDLDQKFRLKKAEHIKPLENEMAQAWKEGNLDAALNLADRIMLILPENREALQVRHKVLKRQRRDRISRLLREADDAGKRQDYAREAELLAKAVSLGADRHELSERLETARSMANKQQEKMEFANLRKLWEDGRIEASLNEFFNFNKKKRERFAKLVQAPHFRWLEEMSASDKASGRKKAVEAVLALTRAKRGLEVGEDPETILEALALHAGMLQSVSDARPLMNQAESNAQAIAAAENRNHLAQAARFLDKPHRNLEKAEQALSALKIERLNETQKHDLEALTSKYKHLESLQMLEQQYESAAARGEHFVCMDMAEKLAELDGDAVSGDWNGKIGNHAKAVKREWSLLSFHMRDIPKSYGRRGITGTSEFRDHLLLPDGRNALLITSHGRWIFIRTFCLDDQTFKNGVVFRTPKRLSLPRLSSSGKMLWIVGEKGRVMALCLEPLTIRYWYDFSTFAKENELIEDTLVFPNEQMLWIQKRNTREPDEIIEIIRLDRIQTIRRINWSTLLVPVNHGGRFEVAMEDSHQRTVRICSENGRTVKTITFDEPCIMDGIVPHPNGVDYVLLTHQDPDFHDSITDMSKDGGEPDDAAFTVQAKPDLDRKIAPLIIEDSHVELQNTMAVLHNAGIIFVYFMSAEKTGAGLLALKPSKSGFEVLYRVSAPKNLIIFSNEHSDGLVAMSPSSTGLKAIRLDHRPPRFEGQDDFEEEKYFFPSFDSIWLCDVETGAFKAEMLARAVQLEEDRHFLRFEQSTDIKLQNDPDRAAVQIRALEYCSLRNEAKSLSDWLKKHHPDHCRVLMESAKNAAGKQDWPRVISLLERVAPRDLDGGAACHRCHLLGMAYFAAGDAEKALRIWKQGKRYKDGRCKLDPYIAYAKLSLKNEKQRKRSRIRNDMKRGLELYETVDQYMNNGDWRGVVLAMESANVLEINNLQLQARLTRAYLNQDLNPKESRFICKTLVLADYCEKYEEKFIGKNQILPYYIETWSDARLKEIETEARVWLEGLDGEE